MAHGTFDPAGHQQQTSNQNENQLTGIRISEQSQTE